MSDNPYASPHIDTPFHSMRPPQDSVRAPAIAMISISSLWGVILLGMFSFSTIARISAAMNTADLAPETDLSTVIGEMVGYILGAVLIIGFQALIVFGGISLLRLRNYPFALAGAIASVIPFCSGCYILGIPFGIWAIIVLLRPEIKAAFR